MSSTRIIENENAAPSGFFQSIASFFFGSNTSRLPNVTIDKTKKIGAGKFGKVYQGKMQDTNLIVAVKTIPLGKDPGKKQNCQNEADIMKLLTKGHSSKSRVMPLIDAYEDRIDDTYNLIMPLLENGCLEDQLNNTTLMDEPRQMRTALGIFEGLTYMHDKGVLHRDLKPANVMLNEKFEPVIIDFGLSTHISNTNKKLTGTPLYWAPEIHEAWLTGNTSFEYSVFTDKYALGLTIWQIFARTDLHRDCDDEPMLCDKVFTRKMKPYHPQEDQWPAPIESAIYHCLQFYPHNRAYTLINKSLNEETIENYIALGKK